MLYNRMRCILIANKHSANWITVFITTGTGKTGNRDGNI